MARDVNGFNKDGDNINGTRYKNGFDINGNAEVVVTYDSNGFSTTSPFYHRDTLMARDDNGFNKDGDNINGTRYKNGFDINGNAEVVVTYDSNGFSTTSPFYHRDTLMARDDNGFNKDGDNINGTRYKNGFDINGNAEVVVTYDSNGFSTTSPFYHRDTLMARDDNGFNKDGDNINGTRYDNTGYHSNGTIYDEMGYDKDGFNQQGYNSQSVYNPFYNRSASPT